MKSVLCSGTHPFDIEVPYKLIKTGKDSSKPLIVYLHGFKQNIARFEDLVDDMFTVDAYHLFIQGPYPIYDRKKQRKVEDWGRAWYLYDGKQDQFLKSLEAASEFIEEIIDKVRKDIDAKSVAIVGYSMGGYLAGYFGLSRPNIVNKLVVIGGRIKTEVFEDADKQYEQLNVLALHGANDKSVDSNPQKRCCDLLSEWGANVKFQTIDSGHRLKPEYVKKIKKWFLSLQNE
ncbi:putative esterase [Fodinibius salinus]|uniref:Putative esterase n=1 Tax=Fodinibius salinus TaxID=860790 RepID=A0A5D3YR70_9BACT|nr:alpha/beta fold hydrolase [Fodinibius salinus]TYP95503.1 putative esterase [Fodinibius salinus]